MTAVSNGRRRGAPKKAPEDRRLQKMTVRMTAGEFEALKRDAADAGRERGVSRYMFDRAMGRVPPIVPAINLRTWSDLGRWAGMLTTVANATTGERLSQVMPHLDPPLEVVLAECAWELRALRFALLGDELQEVPPEEQEDPDPDAPPEEWYDDLAQP